MNHEYSYNDFRNIYFIGQCLVNRPESYSGQIQSERLIFFREIYFIEVTPKVGHKPLELGNLG